MKITLIAGARPNFMKIAPIIDAIKVAQQNHLKIEYQLVHTGQHYDKNMSSSFFEQLNIPQPDANLDAGGGSQATQTANIMIRFEAYLNENPTDMVIVVGDVTSTLACSIVAKKAGIAVAHVEAGIRSGDLSMPEEINRMVTDSITDYYFTTTELASNNLIKQGVDVSKIFFVGNTMIDTLLKNRKRFVKPDMFDALGLTKGNYLVLTLHRPANVDEPTQLKALLDVIESTASGMPVIFPVHPRTRQKLEQINKKYPHLHLQDPMGYLEFNFLIENAKAVITDSGGITEEATVLAVPCITLRDNTERPETITIGTNELAGTDPAKIKPFIEKMMLGNWKKGGIPEKWDGHTATRIVEVITGLKEV